MIDTHTHLTDEPLYGALEEVLKRAMDRGVTEFIVPGYNAESWRRGRELCARYSCVKMAVGLHPLFVDEGTLEKALEEIQQGGIVAVGEIGLDAMGREINLPKQREFFEAQLEAACAKGLPVILHCREAHDELLMVCRKFRGMRAVLHSCSCSHEQVKPFLELGFYVGISGGITRAQTQKVKKLACAVPLERILVETDSPYIGTATHPAPTSEPGDAAEVVEALAQIRGCSVDEVVRVTTKNAQYFFGLS